MICLGAWSFVVFATWVWSIFSIINNMSNTLEDEILEALCTAKDKGLDDSQVAKMLPLYTNE